jgi:hypothetical protein
MTAALMSLTEKLNLYQTYTIGLLLPIVKSFSHFVSLISFLSFRIVMVALARSPSTARAMSSHLSPLPTLRAVFVAG